MSDLQIGLIALGVLLILLVLGFNWWQDRRVRRKMQSHFPTSEQDPCWAPGRLRPSARRVASRAWAATRRAHPEQPVPVDAGSDADDAEEPDPACEVVIEVHFAEPARGADVLPYLQSLRHVGRKPMRVFATTDQGRHRARIHAGELCRDVAGRAAGQPQRSADGH